MKNGYSLLVTILISFSINAQIINIPDENFKNALVNTNCVDLDNNEIGDTDADTNDDGEISIAEAEAVNQLYMISQSITSLAGIEHFVNLNTLYLDNNNLTELSFSTLSSLNELICTNNNISNINITNSPITALYCSENELTELDLNSLTGLEKLDCSNNQLTALNLNGLSNLTELECNNNQLTQLDTSSSINLEILRCKSNNLSNLVITNSPNLEQLECESNQLTSLDLSVQNSMMRLDISDNNLSVLDVSHFGQILDLRANNNQLTSINLADDISLLFLNNNQLTEIEVNNVPTLARLYCENNSLTSLEVSNLTNLEVLQCSQNQLTNLALENLINLIDLECSDNLLVSLALPHQGQLDGLDCSNNQLTRLDFSTNTQPFYNVDASDNQLTSIFFKNGIDDAQRFEDEPGFWNFDLSNNPDLTYICADVNEFSAIELHFLEPNAIPNYTINSYCSFAPGGEFYTIEGNLKLDLNSNGCDTNDFVIPNLNFEITNGSETGNFISNSTGDYSIPVQAGTHTLTPILENSDYFTISPSSLDVNFPTNANPFIQDFCLTSNSTFNDLEIIIIPLEAARPGFDTDYKLIYKNKGTSTLSGYLEFIFSDNLNVSTYVSASPSEDTILDGIATWTFTDLEPFESREIDITLNLNPPTDPDFPLNSGDVLSYNAKIFPVDDDSTPPDNASSLRQTVVNSFDPNDKTCLEGDTITPEQVGEFVHYLIRFENTGSAEAVNIVVKDDMDRSKYDLSSLVPLNASHEYVARLVDNPSNYFVEFIFENINLPFDDANNDGYIVFKIRTLDTLVLNDTFENDAEIYFDFNFPIITNTEQTTVATLSTEDFVLANMSIVLYPNPTTGVLHLDSKQAIKHLSIYDVSGRQLQDITIIGNKKELDLSTEALSAGTYFIKIKTQTSEVVKQFVKD